MNLSPPPLTDKEEYERFDELDQEILDEAKRMEGKHNQELFSEWTKEAKQQFIKDLLINYDLDGNLRIDEILLGYEFENSILSWNSILQDHEVILDDEEAYIVYKKIQMMRFYTKFNPPQSKKTPVRLQSTTKSKKPPKSLPDP